MPELILKLFEGGARPLRTEWLAADTVDTAVALARARVRSSRFRIATVQFDGACITISAEGARTSPDRAGANPPNQAHEGPGGS